MLRNRWPESSETAGRNAPKSPAGMVRKTHSRFVYNSSGQTVGVIGAERTVILGTIQGEHSAALFGNLAKSLEIPYTPQYLYLLWGTSHQTVSLDFLQAGFRGTILNCVFRSIRPAISLHCGRVFRGKAAGESERSDAGNFVHSLRVVRVSSPARHFLVFLIDSPFSSIL
jgi:hypothetical protein